MGNDQPALRALFACESGRKSDWSTRSFDLANEPQQIGEMAKFARCLVGKNNCNLLTFI
jgi:hypothetical protein